MCAKQKGIFKVQGSLDDVTFYKKGDSFLVRGKGGIDKERIANDPNFRRTRENGSEFKMMAEASKLMRNANAVMIKKAYEGGLHQRLMKLFSDVKSADVDSVRGDRQVYRGIATSTGRLVLKGFDFNSKSPLSSLLTAPYSLDSQTGFVTITGLIPEDMLRYPAVATHVSFQAAVLDVNFETGEHAITYSEVVNTRINNTVQDIVAKPNGIPVGDGTKIYVLLVEFTQELNGFSML